jgi:outer membrane murein-binding lipoprotein Lpp
MREYRAMALSAVALGVLLVAGCGPNTTNEVNIDDKKTPGPAVETTYKAFAQKQVEKAAQERAAAKGKAAAKGQPN